MAKMWEQGAATTLQQNCIYWEWEGQGGCQEERTADCEVELLKWDKGKHFT